MTKIKLCGLSRPEDIQAANALQPACVGFVFAPKSKRYVTPAQAADLKRGLDPAIRAVGVFVNAPPEEAATLANEGVIDLIQLHGGEREAYLQTLRALTPKPILQAFRVDTAADVAAAEASGADLVLLDAGEGGTGGAGGRTGPGVLRQLRRGGGRRRHEAGPLAHPPALLPGGGAAPGERRPGSSPSPSLRGGCELRH